MWSTRSVVFEAVDRVALVTGELDEATWRPGEVWLANEVSVVSAGTELARLTGLETSTDWPFRPGYGSIGRIIAGGELGRRVFTYGRHASHTPAGPLVVPVPEGLDVTLAVFCRMAQVSFTALRVSAAELGDTVAVQGLGTVGNLAAQLFQLAGCRVLGLEVSPRRLEVARRCGLEVIDAAATDPVEAVRELTGGQLCATVVEASGRTDGALTAARLAGRLGEVILVGSPRAPATFDALDLLQQVHLWQHGCVTFKGAHEWRYPTRRDPAGHQKHSLERNIQLFFELLAADRLRVAPLLDKIARPEECAEVYATLRQPDPAWAGVIFDWREN